VLGQEYGFASNEKLRFILERLFSVEIGSGYPKERKEPQDKLRAELAEMSAGTHLRIDECIKNINYNFVKTCLEYPNFKTVFSQAEISHGLKECLDKGW
jgi:hypothetical protein